MLALAGDLLLIVAARTEDGDRFAQALSQNGQYAFVFAHDVDSTVAVASSLEPDLIILVLDSDDGIRACQQLRNIPETRQLRVLLVLERTHMSRARTVGANALVVQPASALLLAFEARRVLERTERRSVWLADRRGAFRGGRRSTDIASG
jgi:PleD family two-component response regulator